MFESIEEAISVWKEEFSFIEDAKVTGYDGGYPRAKSKEALLAIINDETMDSAAKDEAVSSYVKLTDMIEKETDAETVLTAKGYTDCIVTVNDDTVDVTLPVANLSDTERAQVEDIVTRKTAVIYTTALIAHPVDDTADRIHTKSVKMIL